MRLRLKMDEVDKLMDTCPLETIAKVVYLINVLQIATRLECERELLHKLDFLKFRNTLVFKILNFVTTSFRSKRFENFNIRTFQSSHSVHYCPLFLWGRQRSYQTLDFIFDQLY